MTKRWSVLPSIFLPLLITGVMAEDFTWKNVEIGSGGFDAFAIYHPRKEGLMFGRSDVCGAYRWDAASGRWSDMLAGFFDCRGEVGRGGVGLAIDPNDTNTLYACRFGLQLTIDGGRNWEILIDKHSGNVREHGEPVAVDPRNPSVIYYGTGEEGLWISIDKGRSWSPAPPSQVPAVPMPGITLVTVDGSDTLRGRSRRVYVCAFGVGCYWSDSAGKSWQPLSGAPKKIARIAVSDSGIAYIAAIDDGLLRFDPRQKQLSVITPSQYAGGSVSAVAVRKGSDDVIVAIDKDGRKMARCSKPISATGWTPIAYQTMIKQQPWFAMEYWSWNTAAFIACDPFHPNAATFGDCFALWRTDDLWTLGTSAANPVEWKAIPWGYENTVVSDLACPGPGTSVELFSAVRDIVGFRHTDVTKYPLSRMSAEIPGDDITGIAVFEKNPRHIAIIKPEKISGDGQNVCTSSDEGVSWTKRGRPFVAGTPLYISRVAMAAADSTSLVAITYNQPPRYSANGGVTWSNGAGLETGNLFLWSALDGMWFPLDNDKVASLVFYLIYYQNGHVYRSDNGGKNWSLVNDKLPACGSPDMRVGPVLRAVPGRPSEVWVSLRSSGLFRSVNGGADFTRIAGFGDARLFCFGKSAPGSREPAVYVQGIRGGVLAVYRSLDNGSTWEAITDAADPRLGETACMAASRERYGRVYMGTRGLGIFYSDIATPTPVSSNTAAPARRAKRTRHPDASSCLIDGRIIGHGPINGVWLTAPGHHSVSVKRRVSLR